ncbi:MAG: LysR family transcriptional regulator [Solirubrobacterales bacterium]
MEIWQLKYFIQVYNENSFSQAAENLHISQQGLSKIIKNMEEELGAALFERSSKGVRPTMLGRILFEKSRVAIKEFDMMMDFLNDVVRLKAGTISVGLPLSLFTKYFATMLWKFKETYLDINLEIVEMPSYACERHMKNSFLDLSFVINPDNLEKINFHPLFSCNMAVLVSEEYELSSKGNIEFEDLQNEKFIMLSSEYKTHQLILKHCSKAGFKPNIVYTTSQIDLILELVSLNKGITILPEPISQKAMGGYEGLKMLSFANVPFKIEIGLISNKHFGFNDKVETLTNYTVEYFKNNEVY